MGNKLRLKCKEYFEYFDSLISDDFKKIINMIDREFIDFKQDFKNQVSSHETAKKAKQRIDLAQS